MTTPQEEEVSILDLGLIVARNKAVIVRSTLLLVLLGGMYGVFTSEEYTSSARVVREAQSGTPELGGSGLGALQSFGVNLGQSSGGLTPSAFPDVLRSREVRLAVVRDTIQLPEKGAMTFVEYANRSPGVFGIIVKYTLRLPWTIKGAVMAEDSSEAVAERQSDVDVPSADERSAMRKIGGMVTTDVNDQSGLMTISVTAQNPDLATHLTRRFVHHLSQRVREIRTEKTRQQLRFVERRFQEVERELQDAEDRLAQFLEQNQNPTTATLRFQRDRLQRQVRFKENLYNNLQNQVTQTRLDLKRQQPVVTVVESPLPPSSPSSPSTLLLVGLCCLLGVFIGLFVALGRTFFHQVSDSDPKEQKKIEEIRTAFSVRGWRQLVPSGLLRSSGKDTS
jgi:uncharacterized protein involved in exopolysaccharide biosynthesis